MVGIALHEPEIPQNTGNIARTCAAAGLPLHLIRPLGFTVSDKYLKRAGLDYWKMLSITYHDSLSDFLEDLHDTPLFFATTKGPLTYSEVKYPENVLILFGKESKGLPEELLQKHPRRCIRIPMVNQSRSLNLSNAAAIMAYEVLRQQGFGFLKKVGSIHLE